MKHYKAPWSLSLIVMSTLCSALCLGISFGILPHTARNPNGIVACLQWLPVALVVICALFAIRGYAISPDVILVHRLLWSTRLPRAGLLSAESDPDAMRRSLRTCGNGGFFSISGFYWNKRLGSYRALVTDPRRAVVLRYTNRRPIVISPSHPEEFVCELELRV